MGESKNTVIFDLLGSKKIHEQKNYHNWYVLQLLNSRYCIAKCSCGTIKKVLLNNIKAGKSKSCGRCNVGQLLFEKRAFTLLKYRCDRVTSSDWPNYGGRGIKNLFNTFEEFINEIGRAPSALHTVDRIDVNKHYCKGNVRWASRKQQATNTRRTCYLVFKGIKQPLAHWAMEFGIKYSTVRERLKRGWSVEDALTIRIPEK